MKRYPLEAARTVRAHGVEQAEAELAVRTSALEEAKQALDEARGALRAHLERVKQEKDALARGEEAGGSAAELARGSAFLSRRRNEEEALGAAIRAAEKAVGDAQSKVDEARTTLAEAQAEKDVVERHHDRFRGDEKRERERRAEAEAEDLAQARRHHGSD